MMDTMLLLDSDALMRAPRNDEAKNKLRTHLGTINECAGGHAILIIVTGDDLSGAYNFKEFYGPETLLCAALSFNLEQNGTLKKGFVPFTDTNETPRLTWEQFAMEYKRRRHIIVDNFPEAALSKIQELNKACEITENDDEIRRRVVICKRGPQDHYPELLPGLYDNILQAASEAGLPQTMEHMKI